MEHNNIEQTQMVNRKFIFQERLHTIRTPGETEAKEKEDYRFEFPFKKDYSVCKLHVQ